MPENIVKGFNINGTVVKYDYNSLENKLELDNTLTVASAAADAKVTGDTIGDLNSLHTTAKNNLVDAINEAAEMSGGLDLSDLIMSATQSQTEGFSTLTLSDGTASKSVDIPVASLDPTDVTLITNIVDDYLDNLVNGDEVSY